MTEIENACQLLNNEEVVALPTETVYGLAGNALSEKAVKQIFEIKNRPYNDPLIIHISSMDELSKWTKDIPECAYKLAAKFWPGALTLLLPKSDLIPDLVTSNSPLVAIRIPSHPKFIEVLEKVDFPLAAPSANPFGYISPTTATHVKNQLGDKIKLIVDGDSSEVGIESTIVGFTEGVEKKPKIYRLGGIAQEQIEGIVGKCVIGTELTHDEKADAPGMLKSHYAPRKPLYFGNIDSLFKNYDKQSIGVISLRRIFKQVPRENLHLLAIEGDLVKAARNLFSVMRILDEDPKIKVILAPKLPHFGLGKSINDRLARAAIKVLK
jgi:L-threonylcarbamoyladenylate synthase